MTTLEQFIADNNVRLVTLSGPERAPLHDGLSAYRNRYLLRMSSAHHSFDFEYRLGWTLNAEDTFDVALILATLIAGENYYRSGEAPDGEHDAAAQKKAGEDLVLLLGGEDSYAVLVDDALDYCSPRMP